MAGTFTGQVLNGMIVLDAGAPPLPDGTKVRVELEPVAGLGVDDPATRPEGRDEVIAQRDLDALRDLLLSFAGKAQGLPPEMAAQHDHYLHGTPKR